jgi:hypothetical protein
MAITPTRRRIAAVLFWVAAVASWASVAVEPNWAEGVAAVGFTLLAAAATWRPRPVWRS